MIRLLALVLALAVAAFATSCLAAVSPDDYSAAFHFPTVRLWEGRAPGATGELPQDIPTLTVFVPDGARSAGAAVIVAPGGAFQFLAMGKEGRQVAEWFAEHGITAFVLAYRLIPAGYQYPVALQDAQRSIRWVRAHAAQFGIDPKRIGMIGFSAGGALTALAETKFDSGIPRSPDPVERVSSRPDFAILAYPALNMVTSTATGANGGNWSVPPDTPPTFIVHDTDDRIVPATISTAFYDALRAAKAPAELHIFTAGGHGFGLGMGDPAYRLWPMLLETWLDGLGLLAPNVPRNSGR